VTLVANPPAGSGWLVLWSGCDAVSGTSCIVTMNTNKSVSAEYIQPIYRRLHNGNGDYLYSADPNEASSTYTQGGGVAFFVYRAPKAGRSFLYRCYVNTSKGPDHFLTRDPNCEGQIKDGPLGYVADSQAANGGLKTIRRYYNGSKANHFTRAGDEGVPSGYSLEGPQGFVPL